MQVDKKNNVSQEEEERGREKKGKSKAEVGTMRW
jgi:hypothetical protein